MNDEEVERLLKAIPGAKRAADGILIQGPGQSSLHIYGVTKKEELVGLTEQEYLLAPFCSRSEIFRLRELKNSNDYLLRIRAEAIANSPRMVRVMSKRKRLYESAGRPWTLTHYYHSHDGYHKAYIKRLRRDSGKALKKIPSGLVPILEVNATCMASLTGEIVVASESLYHFYYFMTIAVYGENLKIDMADRVNALLIAYRVMNEVEAPDFDLDSRGEFPPKTAAKIHEIVHKQMEFTFGHEYAHYLCGHTSLESVSLEISGADARIFSHKLEYEADQSSVRLVQHDPQYAKEIAEAGITVLAYLNVLTKLRETYSLRKLPVSETHPKPLDRLWAIVDFLGSRSPLNREDVFNLLAEGLSEFLCSRR